MCIFIVWYPLGFSRLHNLHAWYWNSLLYSLIYSGENSAVAHFATAIANHYMVAFSFHLVPITAGWTEVAWYERLAQHLHTWPPAWLEHQMYDFSRFMIMDINIKSLSFYAHNICRWPLNSDWHRFHKISVSAPALMLWTASTLGYL